jgi:hypothetical protein
MQPEPIPPDSMRAGKIVEGEWREINRMIWDAMPFEHRVSSIDQFLEGRENDIQSLALPGLMIGCQICNEPSTFIKSIRIGLRETKKRGTIISSIGKIFLGEQMSLPRKLV